MKKFSFLIIFTLCATVFLSSCDKEDDENDQPATVGMSGLINDSIPFHQFEFTNKLVMREKDSVKEYQLDIVTVLESGILTLTVKYYNWNEEIHDGVPAKRYYQSIESADCYEFLEEFYCDLMEASFVSEDNEYETMDPFGPGYIAITKTDLVSNKISGKFDFSVISRINGEDRLDFSGTFHDLIY